MGGGTFLLPRRLPSCPVTLQGPRHGVKPWICNDSSVSSQASRGAQRGLELRAPATRPDPGSM